MRVATTRRYVLTPDLSDSTENRSEMRTGAMQKRQHAKCTRHIRRTLRRAQGAFFALRAFNKNETVVTKM